SREMPLSAGSRRLIPLSPPVPDSSPRVTSSSSETGEEAAGISSLLGSTGEESGSWAAGVRSKSLLDGGFFSSGSGTSRSDSESSKGDAVGSGGCAFDTLDLPLAGGRPLDDSPALRNSASRSISSVSIDSSGGLVAPGLRILLDPGPSAWTM